MRRVFPHPIAGLCLLGVWLLLTQSASIGQLLLGSAVAFLATHALASLQPGRTPAIRFQPALKLAGVVLVDILRSNLAVGAIIMSRRRNRVSGFVTMHLDLTNSQALALLALIVTATPGTLWVEFDRRGGTLLIHVLDLVDEQHWIDLIKGRYEARLIEIFGQ